MDLTLHDEASAIVEARANMSSRRSWVTPTDHRSLLRVFIDCDRLKGTVSRWLGWLVGGWSARWGTRRMVTDAVRHFAQGRSRPGEAGAGPDAPWGICPDRTGK